MPASLTIAPSQQAEVARFMEETGLDPAEFTWAVQPSRYHLIGPFVSALVHTPTGASFRFEFIDSAIGQNRVSVCTPGEDAHEVTKTAASWEEQLAQVREGWNTWLVPGDFREALRVRLQQMKLVPS